MSTVERTLQILKPPGETRAAVEDSDRVAQVTSARLEGTAAVGLEPLAPAIARIQRDADNAMKAAWDLQGNGALFSQLRNIRRELEKLVAGLKSKPRPPLIAVTSALPGEGKSFLSLGLAQAMAAAQEREVILVDADLPKRDLSQSLGLSAGPGFIQCLTGETTVSNALCRSDVPSLKFLPAGQWRSDMPDLMCSSKMDRILDSFRQCEGQRVFIVDTAPVLAFGETAYLAERADLVLLVVRADQTPRPAAEEALAKLKADRPIALVLNGQKGSILDGYYGYGDYYGDYRPGGAR